MDSHVFKKNNDERSKKAIVLIWVCFTLFLVMQGAKNVYTAEIVAIQDFFGKTKAEASLAMTYYFIVYGVFQALLAPLFGRINLKIFLVATTSISAILTIAIAFMPSMEMLYVLCAVNGALQAGVYGGLMATITKYVPAHLLPFANRVMNASIALYGLIAYGVPVYFVSIGRWELPFIILGVLFLASVGFFFWSAHRMRNFPTEDGVKNGKTEASVSSEKPFIPLKTVKSKVIYFAVMLVIVFFGNTMFYLIMQWVPSLLIENFAMPAEFSILITLFVPIVAFLLSLIAISLCEKFYNLFKVSAVLAFVSLLLTLPMIFFYKTNIVLTLVCVVLAIAFGSGSRVCYGSVLAFKMRNEMNSGTYLSATNSVAALTAGIMPPIAGNIIDGSGYQNLFIVLSLTILLACVLTLLYGFTVKKRN